MNRKEAELLLRELSDTNNVNDLSFQWPKDAVPTALPLDEADGATRDLNRLLDLVAMMKPSEGCKKALNHKDIVRILELLDVVPEPVIENVKQRLSDIFNDESLITQPRPHIPPIEPSYQQEHIHKNKKYKSLLDNFNKDNASNSHVSE